MQQQIMDYFREGLWLQNAATEEQKLKTYLLRYLKIFTLSVQASIKDNGALRASALTLYTLFIHRSRYCHAIWYRQRFWL